MMRTTFEVPMRTGNFEAAVGIISAEFESAGFNRKNAEGGVMWTKGDGLLVKQQCVKAVYTGHSVQIQGWLYDKLGGEYDLNGFTAITMKKKLRARIEATCARIDSMAL